MVVKHDGVKHMIPEAKVPGLPKMKHPDLSVSKSTEIRSFPLYKPQVW